MNERPGVQPAQGQPPQQPMQQGAPAKKPVQKKWKATKDQIMQYWRTLRPDTPIQMTPIRYDHAGTTYAQDGVRITGSQEFIGSVLARLKEFLNFETPQTKLSLVYRETDSPSQSFTDNKISFVFYVQAKDRGSGQEKPSTPKLPKPKKVKPPVNPPTGVG